MKINPNGTIEKLKFEDVAHFYAKAKLKFINRSTGEKTTAWINENGCGITKGGNTMHNSVSIRMDWFQFHLNYKPVLRPLADLTEDEEEEIGMNKHYNHKEFHPLEFTYLCDKGFDLFGLIESGFAFGSFNH